MNGIVDSTVIIHLLRNNPAAIGWANNMTTRPGVTSITWLEVMFGAPGKAGQQRAKTILSKFDTVFPSVMGDGTDGEIQTQSRCWYQ